jgi:hypothetical protein
LKETLNTFYRNDHDKAGFLLKEMPDLRKFELEDNANGLKFSFHACGEFSLTGPIGKPRRKLSALFCLPGVVSRCQYDVAVIDFAWSRWYN